MTYPGLPGQIGPAPTSTVGQQIRQSRAGAYPGGNGTTYTTVIDAMDGYAPPSAVVAQQLTPVIQRARDPFPLSNDNFQAKNYKLTVDKRDGTGYMANVQDTRDGRATTLSAIDYLDGTAFDATSTG